MGAVGFRGQTVLGTASLLMIERIYIWGNVFAWSLIGLTLIFYKLDKIYPEIMMELQRRGE